MRKYSNKFFHVALFWVLFGTFTINEYSYGQDLLFQHINVDQGLGNSRVISVIEDRSNFIWFVTKSGIERYNGLEIKNYIAFTDNSQNQTSDLLNCAVLSDKYDLLCGSRNGQVFYYDRPMDRFAPLLKQEYEDMLFNIYALLSHGESLWIGTSNGLFIFNHKNDKLEKVESINETITCISELDSSKVLVGTKRGFAVIGAVNQDSVVKILPDEDIMVLKKYGSKILTGTRDADLHIFGIGQNSELTPLHTAKLLAESIYPITDIIIDTDTTYAISFDGNGLVRTNHDLEIIESYRSDNDVESSLSSNGIYDMLIDSRGILWIATYGGGINYNNPDKNRFEVIRHQPYNKNSLKSNNVNSIVEDKAGRIWFGTNEGISILNQKSTQWLHIPDDHRLGSMQVMAMLNSKDNKIWVATYGKGLMMINPVNLNIKEYRKDGPGNIKLSTDNLFCILEDSYGRIWTGGIWGNITVINPEDGTARTVNISNVRTFHEHNDLILVGSLDGLFYVNKTTLEVSRPESELLVSSRIICIEKDPNSSDIFIGTDSDGIIVWDFGTNSTEHITTREGLISNLMRGIIADQNNNIWLATNQGLSRLNIINGSIDNFTTADGISSSEFTENALHINSQSKIYAGSTNGVTHFYPDEINTIKQRVIPFIKSISLFGTPLEISDNSPLKQNINIQERLYFKHSENSIAIAFSALGFTNPMKTRFKWMLEGFDEQWNGPTDIREAFYTQLPPGDYTFKVMVSIENDIWQEEVKEIGISIQKPFWKKSWAYIIYSLLISGIVYLIIAYYNMHLHEKNAKEKQQFFISIAHDLRTPLSLIRMPFEKILNEANKEEDDTRNLVVIRRNIDRLTAMVNQLLDFQKADEKKMQLQVTKCNIANFIDERLQSFEPLALEKGISLHVKHNDPETILWIDKIKFEKIIFNLLSNALKYTNEGGEVSIRSGLKNSICTIIVSDTGEGIPPKQQKHIFKSYYRASNAINSQEPGSGVGLMLTKELVELHGGNISFTSTFGEGSSFKVEIKTGKDHFKIEDFADMPERKEDQPSTGYTYKDNTQSVNGPGILVVEDNLELINYLSTELASEYVIKKAYNGKEALELLSSWMPDLIISDVMMPELGGHELCNILKTDISTCHIPIIMLTALDSPEFKKEGLESGADIYMEKPFNLEILKTQIRSILKNRSLLKSKFMVPGTDLTEASPSTKDNKLLESIRSYVLNNLKNESLSVESTAAHLNMSRPVLYRKIKSLTDLSPQKFLMTLKLKEAARIMMEENMNISETAYLVGFSDPKYFSQTFKKYFNITPSQYLKGDKTQEN